MHPFFNKGNTVKKTSLYIPKDPIDPPQQFIHVGLTYENVEIKLPKMQTPVSHICTQDFTAMMNERIKDRKSKIATPSENPSRHQNTQCKSSISIEPFCNIPEFSASYHPKLAREIVGSSARHVAFQVRDWLRNWGGGSLAENETPNASYTIPTRWVPPKWDAMGDFIAADDEDDDIASCSDDGEYLDSKQKRKRLTVDFAPQFLMLIGPNGCGKSAIVQAVAEECGYSILESNPGSKRSGKDISAFLKEATQSHRFLNGSADVFKIFQNAPIKAFFGPTMIPDPERSTTSQTSIPMEKKHPAKSIKGVIKERKTKVLIDKSKSKKADGQRSIAHFFKKPTVVSDKGIGSFTDDVIIIDDEIVNIELSLDSNKIQPQAAVAEADIGYQENDLIIISEDIVQSKPNQTKPDQISYDQILAEELQAAENEIAMNILPKECGAKSEVKSKNSQTSLIVIEECDLIFKQDKGFWATMLSILEGSKRPIIFIAQTNPLDEYNLSCAGLVSSLFKHIRLLKIDYDPLEVSQYAAILGGVSNNGDIRSMLCNIGFSKNSRANKRVIKDDMVSAAFIADQSSNQHLSATDQTLIDLSCMALFADRLSQWDLMCPNEWSSFMVLLVFPFNIKYKSPDDFAETDDSLNTWSMVFKYDVNQPVYVPDYSLAYRECLDNCVDASAFCKVFVHDDDICHREQYNAAKYPSNDTLRIQMMYRLCSPAIVHCLRGASILDLMPFIKIMIELDSQTIVLDKRARRSGRSQVRRLHFAFLHEAGERLLQEYQGLPRLSVQKS